MQDNKASAQTTDETAWLLKRATEIDPVSWSSPLRDRLKKRRSASMALAKLEWNTREMSE
jgi:hypothetical protein